jgi:hypothetical protein
MDTVLHPYMSTIGGSLGRGCLWAGGAFATSQSDGIRFSEHLDSDGAIIFTHACKLGLEGASSRIEWGDLVKID